MSQALSEDRSERFESVSELGLALLSFAPASSQDYWRSELEGRASGELPKPSRVSVTRRNNIRTPTSARRSNSTLAGPGPTRFSSHADTLAPPNGATPPSDPRGGEVSVSRATPLLNVAPANTGSAALEPKASGAQTLSSMPEAKKTSRWPYAVALFALLFGAALWWQQQRVPAAPTPSADIAFTVEASPADATIELDGKVIARGTYAGTFPRDGKTHTMRVTHDGYETREVTFRSSAPPSKIELAALPTKPATAPSAETSAAVSPTAEVVSDAAPSTKPPVVPWGRPPVKPVVTSLPPTPAPQPTATNSPAPQPSVAPQPTDQPTPAITNDNLDPWTKKK